MVLKILKYWFYALLIGFVAIVGVFLVGVSKTRAMVSFSGCDLQGLTTTVGGIGNKYYTNANCYGNVNTGSFTELSWIQWATITGSNTLITGLRTNQIYLGNCSVSSTSATRLTGLNCIGSFSPITGSIGPMGPTGSIGPMGPTGTIVLTISGYTLSNTSGINIVSGSYYNSEISGLDVLKTEFYISTGSSLSGSLNSFGENILKFTYGSLPYIIGFIALIIIIIFIKNLLFPKNQYGGKKQL